MKILLAGILGAVAMFIWTAITHMALPLGEAGVTEIPNESAVLSTMQSNIADQTGLYIFPGMGVGKNASRKEKSEAMKHMDEKIAANPSGILMYHAPGRPFTFGKALGIEFVTQLLEAILVVFLLAQTRIESFAGRVGFVLAAGILAAIATNVSYWNWYGFPTVYICSYMLIQIVGFLCIGIVAALVLRIPCSGRPPEGGRPFAAVPEPESANRPWGPCHQVLRTVGARLRSPLRSAP